MSESIKPVSGISGSTFSVQRVSKGRSAPKGRPVGPSNGQNTPIRNTDDQGGASSPELLRQKAALRHNCRQNVRTFYEAENKLEVIDKTERISIMLVRVHDDMNKEDKSTIGVGDFFGDLKSVHDTIRLLSKERSKRLPSLNKPQGSLGTVA